ncbi:hypothetical protein E05_08070 [Plautia stali symbiont]|nr:hypothetical protein E05_08070 [Plautia stali symbiont]
MDNVVNLWPLLGIAAIVLGFVLCFNPVLVVIVAGFVTGLAAHMPLAIFWRSWVPAFSTPVICR